MKKLTLSILFFIVSIACFSQTKIGAQALYGTNTELGIGINANFNITKTIKASPSINYFFGKSTPGVTQSFIGVNADVHYIFKNTNEVLFYPLAGLNYMRMNQDVKGFGSFSNSEIGINIGGGLNYPFSDSLTGVFEGKYVLGNYDQAVFSAGVLFNL